MPKRLRKPVWMRSRPRRIEWFALAVLSLSACVDSARSADMPPELAAVAALTKSDRKIPKPPPLPKAPSEVVRAKAMPAPEPAPAPVPESFEVDGFFGAPDAPIIARLSEGQIQKVERGRGGRSLGFKITLDNGQRGYFKGDQSFSAANWYGEVGAFHLDRMLGIGRVPTVVSRKFPWSALTAATGNDVRRSEMHIVDGHVQGAFVSWIEEGLKPLVEIDGWERWIRVKFWPSTSVSPFQRPAVWKRELDQVKKNGNDWRTKEERLRRRNLKPVPDRETRPAELSDLILFDYLTRNIDRWGGDNANVLTRADNGHLVFLDNGAGFEPGESRPTLMEARLHVLQRFHKRTISALRAFDMNRFRARLAKEPVQPVLSESLIKALAERRVALLEWVETVEKEHGEAIWAWE
jgi:hypothetical protein